jgi:hypothetical protein
MMRRYGMDSMWLAVAFGLGCGLGYVAGVIPKVELEEQLLNRGIRRIQRLPNGAEITRWPPMDSHGNTAWPQSWAGWGREVPPGESLPGWDAATSSQQ